MGLNDRLGTIAIMVSYDGYVRIANEGYGKFSRRGEKLIYSSLSSLIPFGFEYFTIQSCEWCLACLLGLK